MKKSVVVLALALGFSVSNLNATNHVSTSDVNDVIIQSAEISPLCKAAATGNVEEVRKELENIPDITNQNVLQSMLGDKYYEQGLIRRGQSSSGQNFGYELVGIVVDGMQAIKKCRLPIRLPVFLCPGMDGQKIAPCIFCTSTIPGGRIPQGARDGDAVMSSIFMTAR